MFLRSGVFVAKRQQYFQSSKFYSIHQINPTNHSCKLLVVGGGSGGCTIAAKFATDFNKDEIIVLDEANKHYYQPMFTLVGGGIKSSDESFKLMKDVLPKSAKWIKANAVQFYPKTNSVVTSDGCNIQYEYLLVAVGLQLDYNLIPGLEEALQIPEGGVCSNYSPNYVNRTYDALLNFNKGNMIFTFPNSPVKCPGAPQKIMYISEHYLRKKGIRNNANIYYNTSLAVIFGVKKYADALWKIVKQRNININLRTNLIEVKPEQKLAVFENLDNPEQKTTMEYSMLHVTPPMSAPKVLKTDKDLTNNAGFLEVDKDTLQHTKYPNIFGIGDCTSTPNSKTAASVAAQSGVVYKNMKMVMSGKKPTKTYNGYASCPLVTGYDSCILAEFDYNLTPMETFPISQDKEMYLMYLMKKDVMPPLYWQLMLNGYWNGPGAVRKIMHPFQ